MSLRIADRNIKRVKILDDDSDSRSSLALHVADAGLEPSPEADPLKDLPAFVEYTVKSSDAAICDHRLKPLGYANFDGADAVALLYGREFPAILCTRYSKALRDMLRTYRRQIPVLLEPTQIDPDTLVDGFERCIREFKGEFLPSRRPWRTLVRVEEPGDDPKFCYVVLPGWNSSEIISLPVDIVLQDIRARMVPGYRFYANVNMGAESQDELYFSCFEFD